MNSERIGSHETATERCIKQMDEAHLASTLDLVEEVFTEHDSPEEGRKVRGLVEEIRAKEYYLPELELMMVNGENEAIGYAMFSRFSLEGKHADELLILTPVAVKPEYQRQGISRELIESGFERAEAMGFKGVIVEGNPANYTARGFEPSYKYGIVAGPKVHLPRPECLMAKELVPGGLDEIEGEVDYSFYESLGEE